MKTIGGLIIIFLSIQGVHPWCCYYKTIEGYCTNKGYTPGGNKIILEPIEAPVATLEEHSVAQMAYYLGLESSVTGAMVDVAATMEKYADVAAKLSAGLSIWGTLLGFAQMGSPTPDDIINAVNKALATLTDEINDQFTNMQGYVDQQILDLQNELMHYNFESYHTYFSNCIKEVTAEKVNECMEEAERISAADYHKFLEYLQYVDNDDWEATPSDVKKMEVQFLTFRDYAQLRVMILTTLASTYKENSDEYSQSQTMRYLNTLEIETDRYIKYARFCYNTIFKMHNPPDSYLTVTQTCDGVTEQHESWVHTRNWRKCYHHMSPMLLDSEKCIEEAGVRMDGKNPTPSCEIWGSGSDDSSVTCAKYAVKVVLPHFQQYRTQMLESVKNFWRPNIYDRLTAWQEINAGVKEMLGTRSRSNILDLDYLTNEQKIRIKNEILRIEGLKENARLGLRSEL